VAADEASHGRHDRRPHDHDEERHAEQQGHHGEGEAERTCVEHQLRTGREDLHRDQCRQQRDRDQVGDPLDRRVREHPLR
jgi:hypothetical protein